MMSRPKKQDRSLSFEHLETKSSLTSLVGWVDSTAMALVAPQESQGTARFLQYVAALKEVNIERDAPDAAETKAVDQWLLNESPPRERC